MRGISRPIGALNNMSATLATLLKQTDKANIAFLESRIGVPLSAFASDEGQDAVHKLVRLRAAFSKEQAYLAYVSALQSGKTEEGDNDELKQLLERLQKQLQESAESSEHRDGTSPTVPAVLNVLTAIIETGVQSTFDSLSLIVRLIAHAAKLTKNDEHAQLISEAATLSAAIMRECYTLLSSPVCSQLPPRPRVAAAVCMLQHIDAYIFPVDAQGARYDNGLLMRQFIESGCHKACVQWLQSVLGGGGFDSCIDACEELFVAWLQLMQHIVVHDNYRLDRKQSCSEFDSSEYLVMAVNDCLRELRQFTLDAIGKLPSHTNMAMSALLLSRDVVRTYYVLRNPRSPHSKWMLDICMTKTTLAEAEDLRQALVIQNDNDVCEFLREAVVPLCFANVTGTKVVLHLLCSACELPSHSGRSFTAIRCLRHLRRRRLTSEEEQERYYQPYCGSS